tara:strand:+ start:76 stop:342 length:267 start_codon:yes stop_codon:yes gene_type:complete
MDATVYGTKTCTWCEQVIRALKKHTTSITKIDVNEANNLEEMKKFAGEDARTVPQVVIDGEYIGGYTEVDRYLKSLIVPTQEPTIDRG